MIFPYRFHHEAMEELLAAVDWYEARKSGLGLEFAEAVNQALREGVPLTIPDEEVGGGVLEYRRHLPRRFPYSIILELVEGEEPFVLAVAHQRQRQGYWKKRRRRRRVRRRRQR